VGGAESPLNKKKQYRASNRNITPTPEKLKVFLRLAALKGFIFMRVK